MDINNLILKETRKRKKISVSDIISITGFSRAYINRFLQLLREDGIIRLIGNGRNSSYIMNDKQAVASHIDKITAFRTVLVNKKLEEDVVLSKIKKNTGIFIGLKKNVITVIDYAFTEMLNNAIEHSRSEKIWIEIKKANNVVSFEIKDYGIGVFNNIKRKFKLKDSWAAAEELLKGKSTTAPEEHSGEGIFFTSRVGDVFILDSFGQKLIFDNGINDVFLKAAKKFAGTRVKFAININSFRVLRKIFNKYSDDEFAFNKTHILIKLFRKGESYLSRSQAKRVLNRLDSFSHITLDFKGVGFIGQAFADEIFRVWASKHTEIKIEYVNANEHVLFMIKRAFKTVNS